ncbi:hypothetical protein FA95DRAFT_693851 [Auriscalpium vulgare]|uniref:Uncharacterized protein n=1 Tax=Auriscalpium vulgare TaxID=40419 RepID=A0ACB8RBG8_9AGAM|nr:hypothetical protein FA95DRAFT_693851 [Auriscalpium vulgare]
MVDTTKEPSKTTGQLHSTKGTALETAGNLTGAPAWQQAGKEEHAAGENEYNAAQTKGYVEGTADRLSGAKDAVVGAVLNDEEQQTAGNARKEEVEAKQEINSSA